MWDISHLPQVNSTMDWLKNQPLMDRRAVIADSQTQGRGRRGGQWRSPTGNLYLSFSLKTTQILIDKLPFIMAIAMCNALGNVPISLKWPNDLWINGQKLGGILIERSHDFAICGIGLNILSAPENATSLKNYGVNVTALDLTNAYLDKIDAWIDREDWVKAWNDRAAFISDMVSFNHGGIIKSGIFEGIDHRGRAVLLDLSRNIYHAYASGEISQFRPENKGEL